jgi:hypothetical protein
MALAIDGVGGALEGGHDNGSFSGRQLGANGNDPVFIPGVVQEPLLVCVDRIGAILVGVGRDPLGKHGCRKMFGRDAVSAGAAQGECSP